MHDPVCPLILSLYGHPDSGGFWERHCESHLIEQGFETIQAWRSCYWHPKLKLFLIVYVDDFKLAGPTENLDEGWRLIQGSSKLVDKGIEMDPPTKVGRYLGCEHKVYDKEIDWHGENPTVMDPPPPKAKKDAEADAVPAEALSYTVPQGCKAWVRRDVAKRYLSSLPGGPLWSQVCKRVTLDSITDEALDVILSLIHI